MTGALKTGIVRVVRWVFTILGAALGLVLLFILKYLVLFVLGTMAAMLVLMWPYLKPRFVMLRDARRATGATDPGFESPFGYRFLDGELEPVTADDMSVSESPERQGEGHG